MDSVENFENMVRQTADLRHHPNWQNVRLLLAQTGYSIDRIVLFACDGDACEMFLRLALPNGEIVAVTFERDPPNARVWSSIVGWEIIPVEDDEDDMARSAATNPELSEIFGRAVAAQYPTVSERDEFLRLYMES